MGGFFRYCKNLSFALMMIFLYIISYLTFPQVLFIPQFKLFSIFFAIFAYWGGGIIVIRLFPKSELFAKSENVFFLFQLPTLFALTMHFIASKGINFLNCSFGIFSLAFLLVLPAIAALGGYVWTRFLKKPH